MKVAVSLVTVCLLSLPATVLAQYAEPAEHSIIRQTGFGWRNHVEVADGCGCSVPVRADCYDQPCCFRCGLHPCCFLQRVHRMLDCLLPCKKCCCLLGGRCGGCCGSSYDDGVGGLPGLSDPFVDDALVPPKPIADPGTEVRFQPAAPRRLPSLPPRTIVNKPAPVSRPAATTQPRPSPYKVTAPPAAQPVEYRVSHARQAAASPAQPHLVRPAQQSILRRISADEPAPFEVEASSLQPIVRSQSPPAEAADDAIPHNPLRSR